MEAMFGIDPSEILHISAKSGLGTSSVLESIVDRVPPPKGDVNGALSAFLFDSSYGLLVHVYLYPSLIVFQVRPISWRHFACQYYIWENK